MTRHSLIFIVLCLPGYLGFPSRQMAVSSFGDKQSRKMHEVTKMASSILYLYLEMVDGALFLPCLGANGKRSRKYGPVPGNANAELTCQQTPFLQVLDGTIDTFGVTPNH